jgi:hypothetical protein
MEPQDKTQLENCFSCDNDIFALEFYLSGHEEGKNLGEFMESDREEIIRIIENMADELFTPLNDEMIGIISVKIGDDINQINDRNLKYVIVRPDEEVNDIVPNPPRIPIDIQVQNMMALGIVQNPVRIPLHDDDNLPEPDDDLKDWIEIKVIVPQGTPCYLYVDLISGTTHLLTKGQLSLV